MQLDTTKPDFHSLTSVVENQINNSAFFNKDKVLFELRRLIVQANSIINLFPVPLLNTPVSGYAVQILGDEKTLKGVAVSITDSTVTNNITLSFAKKLPLTANRQIWIYRSIDSNCYVKNTNSKSIMLPIVIAHILN